MGTLSGDAVAHAALVAVTIVVYWTVTLTVFDAAAGEAKSRADGVAVRGRALLRKVGLGRGRRQDLVAARN